MSVDQGRSRDPEGEDEALEEFPQIRMPSPPSAKGLLLQDADEEPSSEVDRPGAVGPLRVFVGTPSRPPVTRPPQDEPGGVPPGTFLPAAVEELEGVMRVKVATLRTVVPPPGPPGMGGVRFVPEIREIEPPAERRREVVHVPEPAERPAPRARPADGPRVEMRQRPSAPSQPPAESGRRPPVIVQTVRGGGVPLLEPAETTVPPILIPGQGPMPGSGPFLEPAEPTDPVRAAASPPETTDLRPRTDFLEDARPTSPAIASPETTSPGRAASSRPLVPRLSPPTVPTPYSPPVRRPRVTMRARVLLAVAAVAGVLVIIGGVAEYRHPGSLRSMVGLGRKPASALAVAPPVDPPAAPPPAEPPVPPVAIAQAAPPAEPVPPVAATPEPPAPSPEAAPAPVAPPPAAPVPVATTGTAATPAVEPAPVKQPVAAKTPPVAPAPTAPASPAPLATAPAPVPRPVIPLPASANPGYPGGTGLIQVVSDRKGTVYIDGVRKGSTSDTRPMELTAGTHTMKVIAGDRSKSTEIRVDPGQLRQVEVRFSR